MIEIFPNIYVGAAADLIHADDGNKGIKEGWYVISAAKDPWHREALGYTGRGAPKDHDEYLIARRPGRLILNLIDADNPDFVRDEIVTAVIDDINDSMALGRKVLIHCNQGQSRAPTLALLWLHRRGILGGSYDEAAFIFKKVYPDFAPAAGMDGYARAHWEAE
jgi:hypothetical protein